MLALAIAAEMALAVWALRSDSESLTQLWLVPVARFVWKPLMLVAVSGSLRSWLTGKSIHWRQIRRRNTVDVPVNATMVTASSRLDAPPASGMNSSGPVPTEVESGSASSRTGTNLLAPIRLDQDQPPKTDERN